MVFCRDHVHAHLLVGVHRLEDALGGGTSSGHDVFAFQVSEVLVRRVLFGQQARTDFEDADREVDLLLAFNVVGGGTTLNVNGAVLHQRDTGLGGNEVVLDLQVRHVELFFQPFNDSQLHIMGVANRFAGSVRDVGERNGGVTMPKGDGAGFFDFLQCAGQFGCKNWSANQSCSNCCAQKLRNDAHRCFLDIVFFIEPVCRPFFTQNVSTG